MLNLHVEINDANNDATATPDGARTEAVRLLREIADAIAYGQGDGYLSDTNGNKIGSWCCVVEDEDVIKDEDEDEDDHQPDWHTEWKDFGEAEGYEEDGLID